MNEEGNPLEKSASPHLPQRSSCLQGLLAVRAGSRVLQAAVLTELFVPPLVRIQLARWPKSVPSALFLKWS